MKREYPDGATLPKPKFKIIRDIGAHKNAVKFFQYWKSIPESKLTEVEVRVYRLWPFCDKKKVDPKSTIEEFIWNGKIPFEPDECYQIFIDRFGAGEWKCGVYQTGVKGPICEVYFTAQADWNVHPPKIDVRTIIHGPFNNKEYIAWLEKQPGLDLPWTKTPEQLEEKKDMNVAEALVNVLDRQNERQEKQIEELKQDIQELKDGPDDSDDDEVETELGTEDAQVKRTVTTSVVDTALGILKDHAKSVTSEAAKAYNPIEVAKSVMEMAKEMNGGANGGPLALVTQFMESQRVMFTEMVKEQREEAKFWREKAMNGTNGTSTAVATTPKTLLEQMEEMAGLKSVFRELFQVRERREPDRDEAPAKKGIVETFLESPQAPIMIQTGMLMLANIVYNMTNNGPKKDPQEALKAALGQPAATNGQVQTQPGQPAAAPNPVEEARQATLQFLQRIEKPLVAHFFDTENQGLSGYTFANRMHSEFVPEGNITDRGRAEYMTIRDRWGVENFDKLLRSYPPLWELLQGHLPKYQEFLKQFMDYDRWIQEQA